MKAVRVVLFGVVRANRWPIIQINMTRREVHIHSEVSASADAVWTIAREFCGMWHPAFETCIAEQGGRVRCFTVKGEDTIYREQLTYFSDSGRGYRYKHLEGIRDVENYDAIFTVTEIDDLRCCIDWRATLTAPEPRAAVIAEGTGLVFQMGIDAIKSLVPREVILSGSPTIALTVAGRPSDTLCLFLHGIGGGRRNWTQQLPVAAQLMQSAAMDLRGYGDSQIGPGPSIVEDYCDDILRAMTQLHATRVVLCGLSYGSWIATSFAMRHPEKLAGLILSGGCTGMSEASGEERDRFRMSREVPLDEGKTPKDFAPAVVNMIVSPHATEATRQELFNSMAAIPTATYRDALQCFTQPQEQFDFSKLNMPVLFITGEHDRMATPSEIRGVSLRVLKAAKTPNVRFEVIAGAGHVCNVEAPLSYNFLLETFLKGLST
jgi:pimeloyl-ACP methyl ester carboxylesterase